MIIHRVKLHNFGIYAGDASFNLTPQSSGQYHRPIVLFRGQNGVGKSTLVEAIRLCLHGKLALGNRVTQRDYEAYLERRLHRSAGGETAVNAFIQLEFEHVFLGRRHHYKVIRSWGKPNSRLASDVNIWVDNEPNGEAADEKEFLLRELIPPGVAELFFFDGEKISTLSETGEASDALLSETVKNLLGLHLVEQLDRDLDVYLTRQTGIQELQQYQNELARLHDEETELTQRRHSNSDQLADCRHHLYAKREEIALQEQRIVREGGSYAAQQSEREIERQEVVEAIAQVEQEIYELSRGVLPFAAAPKILHSLHDRLQQEADFERWQASQPIIKEIETRILKDATTENYWEGVADLPNAKGQQVHAEKIRRVLQDYAEPPMPETAVVHRVSAETRGVLLNWIDEALTTAPHQLAAALNKRQQLQEKLAIIDETLKRVPLAKILQPLRDNLRQLDKELGRLEGEQDRLVAEDKRLAFHLDRLSGSKRRVSEQIAGIKTDEHRIKLAARTKLLLDDYEKRLMARKLAQLATQLTKRFNQLSRKRNFIERVSIDPETFGVTLYRAGKPFPRNQLSAGEDQVFAIATLWALREVSGRPLPVIIDTPLSRLDEEHRRAMLAEFIPQVAQQVIVLATETEIDDRDYAFLQPAIAHAYLLKADSVNMQVKEQEISYQKASIPVQEIDVNVAQ